MSNSLMMPEKSCTCSNVGTYGTERTEMHDLRVYRNDLHLIKAQEIDKKAARLVWCNGDVGAFHYTWLRENDPHPSSRHPMSRERLVHPLDVRSDIRPEWIAIHEGGGLSVRWLREDGGHPSLFGAGWLHAHRCNQDSSINSIKPSRAARPEPIEAQWSDVMNDDSALLSWLDGYIERGWSIIKGVPQEKGMAIEFGKRIGTVRSSNFGFYFDVRSKAAPISNAYTANFLPLHTDLPHYEMPPGLQILHCLSNDAVGGASLLADGIAVAEHLMRSEPDVFSCLSQNRLPFRFQDSDSEFNARHPIIECNELNEPTYINWSNSTIAPLDSSFENIRSIQSAIRRFVTLIESPTFKISHKPSAGEALVFDNRRMLHGREAFQPETGYRHFQGCYLDTAEVMSRRNALARCHQHVEFI